MNQNIGFRNLFIMKTRSIHRTEFLSSKADSTKVCANFELEYKYWFSRIHNLHTLGSTHEKFQKLLLSIYERLQLDHEFLINWKVYAWNYRVCYSWFDLCNGQQHYIMLFWLCEIAFSYTIGFSYMK